MKICSTEKEYINAIALSVQKACKRYGYLPSVLVAQSCLENGYGIRSYWDNPQIELLLKYNNMVGIKTELLNSSWNEYTVWQGESLSKQTPEVYNGKQVTITDSFRKYDTIERSFADFLLFINYASNYGKGGTPKYGTAVISIKDPETLIKKVSALGYATGTTYAQNVMRIINKHNLTQYDNLSGVEETQYVPEILKSKDGKIDMSDIYIDKTYITTNNSNNTNDPKYIVIHNTDNFSKTADAKAHASGLYYGYMSGMSWHYVTDDKSIYQCLPHNRGAWHVGVNYGSNNLFGTVNNRNSICIEMCVNEGYDYEKAFQSTVALTKYLMKTLNIPASKVVQHWDVCSKECPSQIRKRGDWARFKKLIGDTSVAVNDKWNTTTPTAPSKSYLSKGDSGDEVKKMQTMLIACGYSCGSYGADGDFGNGTLNALKAFQKDHNLTVDGLYGSNSKAALTSLYNSKNIDESSNTIKVIFNGLDYSDVYNYSFYKNKYEDLRKAFGNNEKSYFNHFCVYGMTEGRQASSEFNVQNYKARYSDLRKAFGNDLPLYYKHYIEFGKREKRNAR